MKRFLLILSIGILLMSTSLVLGKTTWGYCNEDLPTMEGGCELPTFDNDTAYVNSTDSWVTNIGSLRNVNDTQHDSGGDGITLNIKEGWLGLLNLWGGFYCELIGCTMSGPIDMGNNDIVNVKDITADNYYQDDGSLLTNLNIVEVKTANYNANPNEFIPTNIAGGSFYIQLPTAPLDKTRVNVELLTIISTPNVLEVKTGGSDTIALPGGPTSIYMTLPLDVLQLQYISSTSVWMPIHSSSPSNFVTGFPGIDSQTPITAEDIIIDLDARTLTIVPPLGYFFFNVDGNGKNRRFRKDGNVVFPTWTDTTGIWHFYFNQTGDPITTQVPWDPDNFDVIATVQRFFWNQLETGGARIQSQGFEVHLNTISAIDHEWKHHYGTIYDTGLDIFSNAITSGTPAADGSNTVVSLSSGAIIDDNIDHIVTNSNGSGLYEQDLGDTTPATLNSTNSALFPILYLTGDAGFVGTVPATRFPFPFTGNIPQYIQTDGTFSTVTNNYYFVTFLWAIGDPRNGHFVSLTTAPEDFSTLVDAQAFSWTDMQNQILLLADNEIRPLYRLIFQYRSAAYPVGAKQSSLREIQDIRKAAVTSTTTASGSLPATSVTFLPYDNISSTNVQSAIQELEDEKVPYTGATGNVDLGSNSLTANKVTTGNMEMQNGGLVNTALALVFSANGDAINTIEFDSTIPAIFPTSTGYQLGLSPFNKFTDLWLSGDANIDGTIDLGTNTITDGTMTGDWDYNNDSIFNVSVINATTYFGNGSQLSGIPLLDSDNVWTGTNNFTKNVTFTGMETLVDYSGIEHGTDFDNFIKYASLTGLGTWLQSDNASTGWLYRSTKSPILLMLGDGDTNTLQVFGVEDDKYPRLKISSGGGLIFGGGSSPADTSLRRSGVSELAVPNLQVRGIMNGSIQTSEDIQVLNDADFKIPVGSTGIFNSFPGGSAASPAYFIGNPGGSGGMFLAATTLGFSISAVSRFNYSLPTNSFNVLGDVIATDGGLFLGNGGFGEDATLANTDRIVDIDGDRRDFGMVFTVGGSDTGEFSAFISRAEVPASLGAVTTRKHYRALSATIGGGSTLTTQIAYDSDILTGATNNYLMWGENSIIIDQDNEGLTVGEGQDLEIFHDATDSQIFNNNGDLVLNNSLGSGITIIDSNLNVTGHINMQGNLTTRDGGKLWSNSTCTFLGSPDGSTILEVCNA